MLGVQNGLSLHYDGVTRSRRVKAPDVYIAQAAQHATTGSRLAPRHEALPGLESLLPASTRCHAGKSCYVYSKFHINCDFFLLRL
jgi:hypothetical protein